MITSLSTFSGRAGSARIATAMFVSGPIATRVSSLPSSSAFSSMISTALLGSVTKVGSGSVVSPSPVFPWNSSAWPSFLISGTTAPAHTGTSVTPRNSRSCFAFLWPLAWLTFPATVVTASTLSSGLLKARMKAKASSMPGSVSRMMRFMNWSPTRRRRL